ncbi:hypothetical protein COU54_03640 [Candidatus Pacearchaeota archaeon CG10_big_fil_rev_8_21_14_0_10_31_24]|nr:MAG: hypothetical protein COU54_03640 [Candidatus Pacearchaeota archaeon CG10_big_fil_rev_8_21_14_0_10_31_24]
MPDFNRRAKMKNNIIFSNFIIPSSDYFFVHFFYAFEWAIRILYDILVVEMRVGYYEDFHFN